MKTILYIIPFFCFGILFLAALDSGDHMADNAHQTNQQYEQLNNFR
jgi:hypothetical protein